MSSTPKISVRLPEKIRAACEHCAAEMGLTLSAYLRFLAAEKVGIRVDMAEGSASPRYAPKKRRPARITSRRHS